MPHEGIDRDSWLTSPMIVVSLYLWIISRTFITFSRWAAVSLRKFSYLFDLLETSTQRRLLYYIPPFYQMKPWFWSRSPRDDELADNVSDLCRKTKHVTHGRYHFAQNPKLPHRVSQSISTPSQNLWRDHTPKITWVVYHGVARYIWGFGLTGSRKCSEKKLTTDFPAASVPRNWSNT